MTAFWAVCMVAGIVLLATFGYGMWKGQADQQHLNQQWHYQVGVRDAPKAIDPKLKRPVDGIDFAAAVGSCRVQRPQ